LINRLGNALKVTFNGHIKLSASVHFASFEGTPHLQIKVRDTGIGIKQEDKDKIF
jgi:signal transduction histidine kinase